MKPRSLLTSGETLPTSKGVSGKATALYPNGDQYEGEFFAGMRQGSGKYTYLNGDLYEGTFDNDRYHGLGKMTYANGSSYNGRWENGKKSGLGVFQYSQTKDIYSGEWKNNYKHGKGTYIVDKTRTKIVGVWFKGEVQEGKWIFSNGTYFEGSFESNNPKGYGKWHFANGNVEEGEFSQNVIANPEKLEDTLVKLKWAPAVTRQDLRKFN